MSRRTRNGHLELADPKDRDRVLLVIPTHDNARITLLVVDRDAEQQAEVSLGAQGLDELAAEILRIRENHGI